MRGGREGLERRDGRAADGCWIARHVVELALREIEDVRDGRLIGSRRPERADRSDLALHFGLERTGDERLELGFGRVRAERLFGAFEVLVALRADRVALGEELGLRQRRL